MLPKVFVLKGRINVQGATKFVLETGERTFGPVDGARIEIYLSDKGYVRPVIGSYTLSSAVDPGVTIMQDAVRCAAARSAATRAARST